MKKAVVIGATSGIGRELAKILSRHGYVIGITGRRIHLLEELRSELSARILLRPMDVSDAASAMEGLRSLIAELGSVDLIVICAGTGFIDPDLAWDEKRELWKISGKIYRTRDMTQSAIGKSNGIWTTTVAAAVFVS